MAHWFSPNMQLCNLWSKENYFHYFFFIKPNILFYIAYGLTSVKADTVKPLSLALRAHVQYMAMSLSRGKITHFWQCSRSFSYFGGRRGEHITGGGHISKYIWSIKHTRFLRLKDTYESKEPQFKHLMPWVLLTSFWSIVQEVCSISFLL